MGTAGSQQKTMHAYYFKSIIITGLKLILTSILNHTGSTNPSGSTNHSETSFQIPFIISMTITLVLVFILITLTAFTASLICKKRKATPPVEPMMTQIAEYEEIDPKQPYMNNNPAYKTVHQTEGSDSDIGVQAPA